MLVAVAEVYKVISLKPDVCTRCHQPLEGDDPQPQRHQVSEIPPMRPVITEYQLHQLACPSCGEVTRAAWPAGVSTGRYGPRAQAVAALCTGAYRLSKRTTQRMLADLFGLSMSLGTMSPLEAATAQAVAAPVNEACTYVQAQASAHLDETSWREGKRRAWLWVAATTWRVSVSRALEVGPGPEATALLDRQPLLGDTVAPPPVVAPGLVVVLGVSDHHGGLPLPQRFVPEP
jgi:transposase